MTRTVKAVPGGRGPIPWPQGMSEHPDKVAAAIERRQRQQVQQTQTGPDGGGVTRFDLSRVATLPKPDPRQLLRPAERAEWDAREAFQKAAVSDFAAAAELYVQWWNLAIAAGHQIAPFAEVLQQTLVRVARERREAVDQPGDGDRPV